MAHRRLTPPAHLGVDITLAAVAFALGAWRESVLPDQPARLVLAPTAAYLAVHLISALLLLHRRQQPVVVGAVLAALAVVTPTYAVIFAAFAVGRHARARRGKWPVLIALNLGWSLGAGVWNMPTDNRFSGPVIIAAASLLGLYVGARTALVAALLERAERAEREQHLRTEQARTLERTRLAAEMHDIVTHRINLMVLQAGALRMVTDDHDVRTAAEDLRQAGCQALVELRELVGVLRSGQTAGTGAVSITPAADLAALVAGARTAAQPVALVEDGDPALSSPTVHRTLYRVVQESLTNAAKHAPGAHTDIRVHHHRHHTQAIIRNTPPNRAPDPDLTAAGSGTGLIGLRERIAMLGGTLIATDTTEGGFEVRATLPTFAPTGDDTTAATKITATAE